ncbi:hypothetical protein NMY22_g15307 [Coprinellus aureogranulatus]|nr:hypothetical protein NMY22_g15307 [Coprinellus aureogranulatus]
MAVQLPTTPDHLGDLEARQALLSENGEPTSISATSEPSGMAPARRETESRKGDSIAGTIVLVSQELLALRLAIERKANAVAALGVALDDINLDYRFHSQSLRSWMVCTPPSPPDPWLELYHLRSVQVAGIYTLQPTSFANPQAKAAGLTRHQIAIFCVGFPALLMGTWSIWHNKSVHDKPHITTWHGTFGITCIAWMLFQVFLGAGSVWWGGALFGGGMKAKGVWKYHRCVPSASGCIALEPSVTSFVVHRRHLLGELF